MRLEKIQKMLRQVADEFEERNLQQEWVPMEAKSGKPGPMDGNVVFVGAAAQLAEALGMLFKVADFIEELHLSASSASRTLTCTGAPLTACEAGDAHRHRDIVPSGDEGGS